MAIVEVRWQRTETFVSEVEVDDPTDTNAILEAIYDLPSEALDRDLADTSYVVVNHE